MGAYKAGTWIPPTTTDPKLYYGLGAAGSLLQSQAAKDGTVPPAGVNAFLPTAASQPLSHEPHRSTGGGQGSSTRAHQTPTTTWSAPNSTSNSTTILKSSFTNEPFNSSDQFLQSMVIDSFFPPIPDSFESSTNQHMKLPEGFMQPSDQGSGAFHPGYAQPFTVPPLYSPEDTHLASSLTGDPFHSAIDPTMIGLASEESLSLWDNLLREFGVTSPAQI